MLHVLFANLAYGLEWEKLEEHLGVGCVVSLGRHFIDSCIHTIGTGTNDWEMQQSRQFLHFFIKGQLSTPKQMRQQ